MLALAVAALAADQLTKATVVHRLRVGEAVDVLPGLQFLARAQHGHRVRVFTGRLSFVVLLTAGAVFLDARVLRALGSAASARARRHRLLLGGSVSNLWDRAYNNFVTDFIYLRVLPNFNLADSFIVTGVALLIFALVRGDPGERVESFP